MGLVFVIPVSSVPGCTCWCSRISWPCDSRRFPQVEIFYSKSQGKSFILNHKNIHYATYHLNSETITKGLQNIFVLTVIRCSLLHNN